MNVTRPVQYVQDRNTLQWVAPDFVARPAKGEVGTAGKTVFRNPGIHNWDMALFKIVPLGSGVKGPRLQFRWGAYNVFNHTQYATVDTTAIFNPAGEQIQYNLRADHIDASATSNAGRRFGCNFEVRSDSGCDGR